MDVADEVEAAHEATFTAVIGNALGVVRQLLEERLAADDRVGLVAAAGDPWVLSPKDWADALGVDAVDVIGDVVVDAASRSALVIGTNVTDKAVADVAAQHLANLEGWGAKLSSDVAETVRAGTARGLSVDAMVDELTAAGGPLSTEQARRIARTELPAAANGAMLAGWKAGGTLSKKWVTRHDSRVRFDHREADGQTVPVNQPFRLAARDAMYPGDPSLPIELRVNCRCTMVRVDNAGRAAASSIDEATVPQLADLARQLAVPGYTSMTKPQLRAAIAAQQTGVGGLHLEALSRTQLLARARTAGVRGRWFMSRRRLVRALRARNPDNPVNLGRAPAKLRSVTASEADRFREDAGYAPRGVTAAARAITRRRADRTAVGIQSSTNPEQVRERLFREYGGGAQGYAPCGGCGLKLHWTLDPAENPRGLAVMLRSAIRPGLGLSANNSFPVCAACAADIASGGARGMFTVDRTEAFPIRHSPKDGKFLPGKKADGSGGDSDGGGDSAGPDGSGGAGGRREGAAVQIERHGPREAIEKAPGGPLPEPAMAQVTTITVEGGGSVTIKQLADGPQLSDADYEMAEATIADLASRHPEACKYGLDIELNRDMSNGIAAKLTGTEKIAGMATPPQHPIGSFGKGHAGSVRVDPGAARTLNPDDTMPAARDADQFKATLVHEYGHVADGGSGNRLTPNDHDARREAMFENLPDGMSRYGQTNSREAFAEAFMEWNMTDGKTTNPAALAYAGEFGWGPAGG